jgi:hypothetical protein
MKAISTALAQHIAGEVLENHPARRRGARLPITSATSRRDLNAASGCALKHWAGLTGVLDDGRVEIGSNVAERAIRPLALNRKNALFAGSDQGGAHWGVIAALIETCKRPIRQLPPRQPNRPTHALGLRPSQPGALTTSLTFKTSSHLTGSTAKTPLCP